MTIEEKANQILTEISAREDINLILIEEWKFHFWSDFGYESKRELDHMPFSIAATLEKPKGFYWPSHYYKPLDDLIKQADPAECLTSSSEYIRECKKWFINNPDV